MWSRESTWVVTGIVYVGWGVHAFVCVCARVYTDLAVHVNEMKKFSEFFHPELSKFFYCVEHFGTHFSMQCSKTSLSLSFCIVLLTSEMYQCDISVLYSWLIEMSMCVCSSFFIMYWTVQALEYSVLVWPRWKLLKCLDLYHCFLMMSGCDLSLLYKMSKGLHIFCWTILQNYY